MSVFLEMCYYTAKLPLVLVFIVVVVVFICACILPHFLFAGRGPRLAKIFHVIEARGMLRSTREGKQLKLSTWLTTRNKCITQAVCSRFPDGCSSLAWQELIQRSKE